VKVTLPLEYYLVLDGKEKTRANGGASCPTFLVVQLDEEGVPTAVR